MRDRAGPAESPQTFVLTIFRAPNAPPRCRVTEVRTRRTWVSEDAEALLDHLLRGKPEGPAE